MRNSFDNILTFKHTNHITHKKRIDKDLPPTFPFAHSVEHLDIAFAQQFLAGLLYYFHRVKTSYNCIRIKQMDILIQIKYIC